MTPSSSEGKHLMLMLAVDGKGYRHITFGAESGSAAEADVDVVANTWLHFVSKADMMRIQQQMSSGTHGSPQLLLH